MTPEAALKQYEPMVRSLAGQFAGRATFDDLAQEGRIALAGVASKLDALEGSATTYAYKVIKNSMITLLRREMRYPVSEYFVGSYYDAMWPSDSGVDEEMVRIKLQEIPPKEQRAIHVRIWQDGRLQDVAYSLGFASVVHGKRVYDRGLRRLRPLLANG